MRIILTAIFLVCLAIPASASELTAPQVPPSGRELMPEAESSFGEGLLEMGKKALRGLRPDLREAGQVCLGILAAALLTGILSAEEGPVKRTALLAGTGAVSAAFLGSAGSLIQLAQQTIGEISEYGKLLLPVMTSLMAAQGGLTGSAALYAGTAVFSSLLGSLISRLLLPGIGAYLALSLGSAALGEGMLKGLKDSLKGLMSWVLKTLLTVFTTYMGITGVISGTTDAAALKATRVAISTVVPVVGGILSDASEAVLVSAGLARNAAGIYGIFAMMAVCLGPFLKIGAHYLLLKVTAALCELFGPRELGGFVGDLSGAMGLLLGITGAECLLFLVSTVCFLRGVG